MRRVNAAGSRDLQKNRQVPAIYLGPLAVSSASEDGGDDGQHHERRQEASPQLGRDVEESHSFSPFLDTFIPPVLFGGTVPSSDLTPADFPPNGGSNGTFAFSNLPGTTPSVCYVKPLSIAAGQTVTWTNTGAQQRVAPARAPR
jgi:hypothetical protein